MRSKGPVSRPPCRASRRSGEEGSTSGLLEHMLNHYTRATLAVLDGAGHALPHEQRELLAGLLQEWLARTGPNVWVAWARQPVGRYRDTVP
jgi:hypothetical protein